MTETSYKWLEEHVLKISNKRKPIEDELASLKVTQDQLSMPVEIDQLKNSVKAFLDKFKKLPNQNKRGFLERFFQKIVIKSNNVIECTSTRTCLRVALEKK